MRNSRRFNSIRSKGSKRAPRSLKRLKFGVPRKSRHHSAARHQNPYMPPEDWFEPSDEATDEYSIVAESAGIGYLHPVTPTEIRERLAELPEEFLDPLNVVKLSGMTRKKSRYPLYGMQWGATIYLYPMDESLTEHFHRPPSPAQRVEATMYGAKWSHPEPGIWRLSWNEKSLKDFYLNNVLIHELGHLLDERNRRVADREAFAEWFAVKYGYKPSRDKDFRHSRSGRSKRRHHSN